VGDKGDEVFESAQIEAIPQRMEIESVGCTGCGDIAFTPVMCLIGQRKPGSRRNRTGESNIPVWSQIEHPPVHREVIEVEARAPGLRAEFKFGRAGSETTGTSVGALQG